MKITIRDVHSLKSLRPSDIAVYLRTKGWNELNFTNQRSTWIARDGIDEFEILLPLDNTVKDYALRTSEILKNLELFEQRSQFEIFKDIQTTSTDTIRLRFDIDSTEGSLPIEKGVEIIQNTWNMMMAAACSTISPRQIFQSKKPTQAVEYMKKVRLGQTEQGSYIFTILSPVSPELRFNQTTLLGTTIPEIPFERKVTKTLSNGLNEMKHAAERYAVHGSLDNFESIIDQGVSANLCESVAKISEFDDQYKDLNIDFSWSRTRPVTTDTLNYVHIASDLMPVFEEVARVFKETAPRDEFEVIGPVIKLYHYEGDPTGKITVWAPVDDRMRRISIVLPHSIYHLAVQAHDNEQEISCFGRLVHERRTYSLTNPREFSILDE